MNHAPYLEIIRKKIKPSDPIEMYYPCYLGYFRNYWRHVEMVIIFTNFYGKMVEESHAIE